MFFALSKTVALLFLPSNFLLAVGLAGVVLMATRFYRLGAWLAAGSLLMLTLVAFSPVGSVMSSLLEERFPPWDASRGAPDGIIVLGGVIDPEGSRRRGTLSIGGTVERLTVAAELARKYPQAKLVFTGGNASLLFDEPPEADFVVPFFEQLGVPRSRVMLESRSRNTAENAVFTKEMVQPKEGDRWLVVTSAAHMPRAMGCFRRVGFAVEAHPVDWTEAVGAAIFEPAFSLSSGLARADTALREWLGLAAYRFTGRSSAFFPAP